MRRAQDRKAAWREAYLGCNETLEALAQSTGYEGQMAARTWWVACMGTTVAECKQQHMSWAREAQAALPAKVTAAHALPLSRLPAFDSLARCIVDAGAKAEFDVATALDSVVQSSTMLHAAAWARAVGEVAPLRGKLQEGFLPRPTPSAEPSLLSRAVAAMDEAAGAHLAPSAAEMSIDEVRGCQVWMYAIARRLQACRAGADAFASAARLADPNAPLKAYDEAQWDHRTPHWQSMEDCVQGAAVRAGTEADMAWRGRWRGAAFG